MFYDNGTQLEKDTYKENLQLIGKLSNLFSDSTTPYLYYRIAEKIFCNSFLAEDLSRGDVSIDAKKEKTGIGLKTFLIGNNKTFQKVAEFNSDKDLYRNLPSKKLVEKVASLRNKRIEFAKDLFNLDNYIYHCVLRDNYKFKIFEESMELIDIDNIQSVKENKSSILFNDGKDDYSFLLSKSTLTKRFVTEKVSDEFEVSILENPLQDLLECLNKAKISTNRKILETIYLPLYGRNQEVYERSGLNQWNAKGRVRDINEVYIPIPRDVHKISPSFFPQRDTHFNLILPNGKIMVSKVCQDGRKALMSRSNKELGKWILRDVLKLKENELLTYLKLQEIGIDSVRIDKLDRENFEINFSKTGSYENFLNYYRK